MKTPESVVLVACLDYLRLRGHFVMRINCGSFRTERGGFVRCSDVNGTADIVGTTKDGRALAVEVKSETGRQSEEQKAFAKQWTGRGGMYVLARGIEDLKEAGL